MPRVAVALTCTAEQRGELMALARSRTEEARLGERAKIVLACLEGKRNAAVGRLFGVGPETVGRCVSGSPRAGLAGCGKNVHGLKSAYKRHGPVNLFAALEVASGVIQGKTTQTKKRVDFQAFMTDLVAEQPPDREIHVILDNLSTHKKNDDWLAVHPNVTFHFTPTSASWLNQVEIWFGIFSRKALAGASFASIAQLVQAIRDFTQAYNRNAAPFVWRKREVKGAQLRNTIVNLRN